MKNNILLLTKKNGRNHSLEIDLSKHMYSLYFSEDDDEDYLASREDELKVHYVSESLFDSILNSLKDNSSYEEDYEHNIGSVVFKRIEKEMAPYLKSDENCLKKEEIYPLIKNGLLGISENKRKEIMERIHKHGVESAHYLVYEDILNIYRKYIKFEISSSDFAYYSYFLCHVLSYNTIYDDDDINYMIADIAWGFDGLAFCGGYDIKNDQDEQYINLKFYSIIKSCGYKIDKFFKKRNNVDIKIKNRYLIYVLNVIYDTNMYLIHDTKTNRFNYGFFYNYEYQFNLDYFYNFMDKDDFYELVEYFILNTGDDDFEYDEKLTIFKI